MQLGKYLLIMTDKTPAAADVLASLESPIIIDVRDSNEVINGKGGPPKVIPGSFHVPLNIDGQRQTDRETTVQEFLSKLSDVEVELSKDIPIITHCGSGGRGGKASEILRSLGYNAYNGGSTAHIAASRGVV